MESKMKYVLELSYLLSSEDGTKLGEEERLEGLE